MLVKENPDKKKKKIVNEEIKLTPKKIQETEDSLKRLNCETLFRDPRASMLQPLLFNIYICDIFYDINVCDIASYADDNTPYTSSNNLDAVINYRKALTTCFNGLEIIT